MKRAAMGLAGWFGLGLLALAAVAPPAWVPPAVVPPARAQQLPSAHGFSFGTSSGSSTFSRQLSRSEAGQQQQVLLLNAAPLPPGTPGAAGMAAEGPRNTEAQRYTIVDPQLPFSVIESTPSRAVSDTQSTVGGTTIRGLSFSVFSN